MHVLDEDSDLFDYPVIKNRFDDIDLESIPFHWSNINPLLYHLLIWAFMKNSILERSDEESKLEHKKKQIDHK